MQSGKSHKIQRRIYGSFHLPIILIKKHWNSVRIDGDLSDKKIEQ